jgi:23S rRNA pseudouridine1911/1915/1917 synthase
MTPLYIHPDLARIERTFLTKRYDFKVFDSNQQGSKIISILENLLPHIDPSSWEDRLLWGGVFLNGQDVLDNITVDIPCRIEYYEPKFNFKDPNSVFPPFNPNRIVYKDEHLLLYSKPQGMPCVPAREQKKHNLRAYLETYLGHAVHMPSRLDLSTEGLVPISISPLAHNNLQQAFQKRRVEKVYFFETSQIPDWKELDVKAGIFKHESHPVLRSCSETKHNTPDYKEAHTKFTFIKETTDGSIIQAVPLTGRTHQIRVHAQHVGLPLIGDHFYGGKELGNLRLLCYHLALIHPFTKKPFSISVPKLLWPEWFNIE